MFKDARSLDRTRTAASFDKAHQRYVNAAESWFNGGVDSIDARLAACTRLLHSASSVVARSPLHESRRYLLAIRELEADQHSLQELRGDLLTGASSRADVVGPPGWSPTRVAFSPVDPPSMMDEDKKAQWREDQAAGRDPMARHLPDKYRNPAADQLRTPPQSNVPPGHFDPSVGDYAVHADPGMAGHFGPPTGYGPNGQKLPAPLDAERSRAYYQGPGNANNRRSSLSGSDQRWVTLESAKFVAANSDCLDDSHELATRAANYVAVKTSTFTPQHSAAVSREFVAAVGDLGAKSYRPTVKTAAVYEDFDPQALFL